MAASKVIWQHISYIACEKKKQQKTRLLFGTMPFKKEVA